MRAGGDPDRGGAGALVPLVGRSAGAVADALEALLGEAVAPSEVELVAVASLLPAPGGRLLFVPIAGAPGGVLVSIDGALARRRPASWPAAPPAAVHAEIANVLASKLLAAVGEALSERFLPEPPIGVGGSTALRELEGLGVRGRDVAAAVVTLRCGGGEALARLGLVFPPA